MPALLLKFLPYILVVAIVLGGLGYMYHKGQVDQKNATNTEALHKNEEARKDREKIDTGVRDLSDDAALKCLRNPGSC